VPDTKDFNGPGAHHPVCHDVGQFRHDELPRSLFNPGLPLSGKRRRIWTVS
jgi:hypothetical protein